MGFIQDNLVPFFKKKEIVFLESYKESEDAYTFIFEKDKDLTWKAGQYGLFTITHKNVKNATKPFSVNAAPAENIIRITTRISDNPSDYKKALLELEKGTKVIMRGPVGPFYLQDSSPAILIAGGIGITPFRSILKQLEAERNRAGNKLHLLYMDSDKSYLFKDELDGMTSVNVTYLDSRDSLHQEIDKYTAQYKNDGKYFIAGPQSMANELSSYVQSKQIAKRNIVKDAFFGY